MDQAPRTGSLKTITFEVLKSHCITFSLETEISVLSTPSLIWFLEQAALQFLEPWLDEKSLSVGTHVDLEHLAPTPIGTTVSCTARLIYQDAPVYRFSVEAYADQDKNCKRSSLSAHHSSQPTNETPPGEIGTLLES